MQWSKYQEAFFSALLETSDSLRVEAVAGSGKTTTSVAGVNKYCERLLEQKDRYIAVPAAISSPRILALAFNKKIAVELEKRMPSSVLCKTMNSIGHSAVGRMLGRKLVLDSDKLFRLAQELKLEGEFGEILALTRAARANGLVPKDFKGSAISLMEDSFEEWDDLAFHYDIEFNEDNYQQARILLIESIHSARRGLIDFDDQIYMSALFGAPFYQYDLVLVDEAQDLSLVQHRMLTRCIAQGGRLIAVGDSHQAIYGFRGASANSLNLLSQQFNLKEVPLSISYRCPKRVVYEAQKYVPHIEPSETAPEGEVIHWDSWGVNSIPTPCTIVCRNNAPLLDLAWKLISSGRGVTMLGRDIGKGLVKLVEKLAPAPIPIEQFYSKLYTWMDKEIARKPKKEGAIRDKGESLLALGQGVSDTKELISLANKLFSSEGNPIVLSSIHKAKGLEWPNVIFLDSWRIPSKWATRDWEKDQENNCAYIAITRAQEKLIYANLERFK